MTSILIKLEQTLLVIFLNGELKDKDLNKIIDSLFNDAIPYIYINLCRVDPSLRLVNFNGAAN